MDKKRGDRVKKRTSYARKGRVDFVEINLQKSSHRKPPQSMKRHLSQILLLIILVFLMQKCIILMHQHLII